MFNVDVCLLVGLVDIAVVIKSFIHFNYVLIKKKSPNITIKLTLCSGLTETLITSELSDFCLFTNSLNVSIVVDISLGSFICFGDSAGIQN